MANVNIAVTVNGDRRRYEGDGEMPLLWFLREDLNLVGAKFGCGLPTCGACKVHVNEALVPACSMPMAALDGANIRTIEGLGQGEDLHPVQQAWLEEDVAQCGYCQSGQIMAAAYLLERNPNPSDEDIDEIVTNICRCGTYARVRKAIHRAAELMGERA